MPQRMRYQTTKQQRRGFERDYIGRLQGSIEGRGFIPPALAEKSFDVRKEGFEESFAAARPGYLSSLNRFAEPGDTKLKGYLTSAMDRGRDSTLAGMDQTERYRLTQEKDMGMTRGMNFLSDAYRGGTQDTMALNQAYSQQMALQNRIGTLGGNLAAGGVQGMIDYQTGMQLYSQRMAPGRGGGRMTT